MKILNSLRYLGWRMLDMTKNDSVHKRLKNIENVMEDDSNYKKYIEEKLKALTEYATKETNYYSLYQGHAFEEFPVINKNIIMDLFEDFESKEYINRQVHTMSTSGSTGRPFKIKQDFGKRNQVLAEIMYFSGIVGYKVGRKMVYLRNLESTLTKSAIKQFVQNESVIATQKYDDDTIGSIVDQLIHMERGTTILGYASTLQMIASYMERHNMHASNITGIISGAEAITSKTRKLVNKQFGCPVVSRYSNQEMGILAQDFEEDEFLLNRASYYFEVLKMDKDEKAEIGEMGRIVITDLYNYAMPMIRYDTGDLGIMKKNKNGREYLAKVLGRKLDLLYTTKDEPLSFFAIDEYFEPNFDIEQYQFIQEDRTHLTVNVLMKKGKSIDENWCIDGIKKVMGEDCIVSINYLDTVPITNSGKFRYVICNYKPEEN